MKTTWTALAAVALLACGNDDKDDTTTTDDSGGTNPTAGFAFASDAPTAYTRVDRMGMPAVATAVITSKDAYNAADPSDDAAGTFVPEIIGNVTAFHDALDDDLTGLDLVPCDPSTTCASQAAPFIVPDTLQLDTSAAPGFPNGRMLPDPVIDVTLALALLDLGVEGQTATTFVGLLNPTANDVTFPDGFPYLASAQ